MSKGNEGPVEPVMPPSAITAKQRVIARYADAEAVQIRPVYQYGQSNPIQNGYWSVSQGRFLGAKELGQGPTELEAWEDVASKLDPPPVDKE